jgi:hypothetical protein
MSKLAEYQNAIKKIAEAKQVVQNTAKEVFAELASPLFEAHPQLENFSWRQYTPYFNDGEPCEFSANKDAESIDINGEDGYEVSKTSRWDGSKCVDLAPEELHPLHAAQEQAAAILAEFDDDTLHDMFGDHAEVTVKRDGTVDVEEYSHD